jgi:hypothetical protein
VTENQGCSKRSGKVLSALILGAALVWSSSIVADRFREVKLAQQVLTVKGLAEKSINSNLGVWRGSFAVERTTVPEGYSALQSDTQKVQTLLGALGVKPETIEFGAIQYAAVYKLSPEGVEMRNEVLRYNVNRPFVVTSTDVPLIQRVAKESSALLKEGVGFYSSPPEYHYTGLDSLKIEMLGEAARDAKVRAERLASSTGNAVGALRGAQQGVFQITSEYSGSVSDYGEFDTSSLVKKIKAVVTMQFAIK